VWNVLKRFYIMCAQHAVAALHIDQSVHRTPTVINLGLD
jgi:hypothetical protein